ncbi:hypothetical protein [Moraxella nonliquefaciens]|uniref:Uncharacterized protein n=1 Tax=Moraxella nonliquefaciens TaxID=478 RepID=A0A1B8PIU2_MORNO|nr:hypothetical protein [Moraxella nonliquefaciens]OBX49486.1 hypothetical protein A9Z60_03715 [Moraxella nonliquefaciens]
MKIILSNEELQAIVTEALNAKGIDTSNAEFTFDNGAEIELNSTHATKPKPKKTRTKKQEVFVGTQDEFDDSNVVINEPNIEPEEEINDFEDELGEEPTEETDSDDDSDSLFD